MKKIFSIASPLIAPLFAVTLFLKKKRSNFPLNRRKALINIRPFDLLTSYIESFREKWYKASEQICFDKDSFPQSITYNRDAFIALINAPKAAKVRIYFGLGPKKGARAGEDLILCILPVDANDNVIRAELVKGDYINEHGQKIPQEQLSVPNNARLIHPLLMGTPATSTNNAQGVDDGQRQPSS